MGQPERRMLRYTVLIDSDPHVFYITGEPRAVAAVPDYFGPSRWVVEFWAEDLNTPDWDRDLNVPGRRFQVYGTGHVLPPDARWVGTTERVDGLVWHLYERTGPDESV